MYTKDELAPYTIWVYDPAFGAYLHKEYDDKYPLGIHITPHFSNYDNTLWLSDLAQTATVGSYWIDVGGFNYGENVYGKGSLSHNDIWFRFKIVE